MEKILVINEEDEQIELPPGFRFHPTDEELITFYLEKKVLNSCFSARAIGEVDLNRVEPWDLPWRAKMGEKEWYFFCVRDRKYPTGLRTNRATAAGYWKATGKDKEIFKGKSLVGMKKTLVFYRGRAPKGEKTDWVMHEYRLEGKNSIFNPKIVKNDWVICRVFQKRPDGRNVNISGLARLGSPLNRFSPSVLPPLIDLSPYNGEPVCVSSHVTCFSSEEQKLREELKDDIAPLLFGSSSTLQSVNSFPSFPQLVPHIGSLSFSELCFLQDDSVVKMLIENRDQTDGKEAEPKPEFSRLEDSVFSTNEMIQGSFNGRDASARPIVMDCLWNY